ncbi:MAG: hypothetical protein QNJ55_06275 [Xenococcus sp. MO_188.B8]|nr:hypothetical protein [Xenococcus sp. MO_188.B8]
MECKLKHLDLIQGVINRMASNSFSLKNWTVVLVSALFALAAKNSDTVFIAIAFLPVAAFWLLDGYFLRQERLYRKLYDRVIKLEEKDIDFSMNTTDFSAHVNSWLLVCLSKTLLIFYGFILATIVIVVILV